MKSQLFIRSAQSSISERVGAGAEEAVGSRMKAVPGFWAHQEAPGRQGKKVACDQTLMWAEEGRVPKGVVATART